ncbi:MAG: glycosyltransferase [Balneolaceae bacterium]
MLFSVIIPVYNRPEEVDELLESLTRQSFTDFEVLIVEDGSTRPCREIVDKYREELKVRYFYKENSGQGFSRNYGFERAEGEYFVVFDSDCLIPPHYFKTVARYLEKHPVDAWGGPDRAHPEFSPLQKAISYTMSSPLTTGGIRGHRNGRKPFHPRSFNMGISREVFQETGGYRIPRMGEDIEFSIRILKSGFKAVLIRDAYVYHKRRANLLQFFRQVHFFGRARINIRNYYPDEVNFIHSLPALFTVGMAVLGILLIADPGHFLFLALFPALYFLAIFLHAYGREKNLPIAGLSILSAGVQLFAYGSGFIREWAGFRRTS